MAKTDIEKAQAASTERAVRALERLAIVIGAVAVNQFGDTDLPGKAKRLRRMGFANVEIADMLGSTANSIGVALHRGKKKKKKKKKKKQKKARTVTTPRKRR